MSCAGLESSSCFLLALSVSHRKELTLITRFAEIFGDNKFLPYLAKLRHGKIYVNIMYYLLEQLKYLEYQL